MLLRSSAFAAILVVAACANKATATADAAPSEAGSIGSPLSVDASSVEASSTSSMPNDGAAEPGSSYDCTDTSAPRSGKSIGHTSVVFKLELANGKKVAWKPDAKKVKGRYKGEIAAYRLAEALGIHNVPPACARTFDASVVASALASNEEASKVFAEQTIVERGKVRGAIIPWIEGLRFWPLEKEPLRTEAREWLTAGHTIPTDKTDLARQASNLVAFDFVTGNWDRYSGENVGLDKTGKVVLFIDNDAAFMEGVAKDHVAKSRERLVATDRFSRDFVARVRALDEGGVAAAIGEEEPGKPLLSKTMVALVTSRMKELLSIVEGKSVMHGAAETLYFR